MKKIVLILLLGTSFLIAKGKLNIIEIDKAEELFNGKKTLFIDARPYKKYQIGTIMGAINITPKLFDKQKRFLPINRIVNIVTFCGGYACKLSDKVADRLQKAGYKNVFAYKGGYPQWKAAKKPTMALVRKGNKTQSGSYKPTLKPVVVNGVKLYMLPEDGEANEDGLIDQFWLNDLMKGGKKAPKGIHIVDTRKAKQYKAEHINGAISVPYDKKNDKIDTSLFPKDGIVVLHCNSGVISVEARQAIKDEGLQNRVFIYDISYVCDKKDINCKLTPNEAL
jgi:rhodanese-related sulfurtransferase